MKDKDETDSLLKPPAISVTEILKLIALLAASMFVCLLMGLFIGGFFDAWGDTSLFLAAIKTGTAWGIGVLVASGVISCVVTYIAGKTRFFISDRSLVEPLPESAHTSQHNISPASIVEERAVINVGPSTKPPAYTSKQEISPTSLTGFFESLFFAVSKNYGIFVKNR